MNFSGDILEDVCIISFLPVVQLENPVGFDSRHAFECECIVQWLTRFRATNPVTGQTFPLSLVALLLHPLVVDGREEHVNATQGMLDRAGWVIDSEVGFKTIIIMLGLFFDSCPSHRHRIQYHGCPS